MEASLNKININCFEEVYNSTFTREETAESVVPDTMPDIKEILGVDGMVTLRSKEAEVGRISVSGDILVTVLYLPEGQSGMCKLSLTMPYSASVDAPGVDENSALVARLNLCSIDARMLNPRKILVRADVGASIKAFNKGKIVISNGLNSSGGVNIQVRSGTAQFCPVTQVREKTFVITDEYQLPTSKPPVGELLTNRVEVLVDDVKSVGNKLIIKGGTKVAILYSAASDGQMVMAEYNTPFSQILEVEGMGGQPTVTLELMLTGAFVEIMPTSHDGRVLSGEFHLVAQAVCYDTVDLTYVSDAYSNEFELDLEYEDLALTSIVRTSEMREAIRDLVETENSVREVIGVWTTVGMAYIESGNVKCPVSANIMYRNDSGELSTTEGRFLVEMPFEGVSAGMSVRVLDVRCGETFASAAAGGVDLRLPVEFRVMIVQNVDFMPLTEISVMRENPINTQNKPSLVVVKGDGAGAWTLAKKYNSTIDLIAMANNVEPTGNFTNELVLIPRAR